jgi:hypothetical protein
MGSGCDGISLARLGDLDGDGVDELGAAFEDMGIFAYAQIYSGKTGARLRTHSPERTAEGVGNLQDPGHYGVSISGLGDLDADGVGEYAIGSSGGADGLRAGCISVYSGRSGQLLRVIRKRDLVGR